MSYIIRNEFGAFCPVCQSWLGLEEDAFNECDTCGGEGFGEDPDWNEDEHDEPVGRLTTATPRPDGWEREPT